MLGSKDAGSPLSQVRVDRVANTMVPEKKDHCPSALDLDDREVEMSLPHLESGLGGHFYTHTVSDHHAQRQGSYHQGTGHTLPLSSSFAQ